MQALFLMMMDLPETKGVTALLAIIGYTRYDCVQKNGTCILLITYRELQ
jgi:hypothetical protein